MSAERRSGVLAVDKGAGVTSFQVVDRIRRLLRAPKVGHGGTLDPDATGVLPVLVGEATKLTPYLVDLDKEYVATVRLGVITDTQDLAGAVLETRPVPAIDRAVLEGACARFVGAIRQVPPMYSALHHEGRRLHELARAGVEVERAPREIVVHALVLEAVALPDITLRVTCGKGTYVRTLAADLGAALGCGAALARLVRARVGPYHLDAAIAWSEVREAPGGERLWSRLEPPASAVAHLAEVRLADDDVRRFRQGQAVALAAPGHGLARIHGSSGELIGVGRREGALVRPERVLHADPARPGLVSR
ncbi:MAG: tRNA pseudouridine(55) synthase TruB [Candidatus Rokubacteria bacterium]|nr:tRNA pseudouridine(55) synthase TruB [Candidatus Rokubacteria bacterium]